MRLALLLVVPSLAVSTETRAQSFAQVEFGSRVRLTIPNRDLKQYEETFYRVSGDTLVLESMWCLLTDVTKLEVFTEPRSHVGKGARIGAGVGTGIGVTLSALWIANDCEFVYSSGCETGEVWVMAGGVAALSLLGAITGGTIGSVLSSDGWENVRLDRLQVSIAPTRSGFGIGARIAF
jgi:hypothetical protein